MNRFPAALTFDLPDWGNKAFAPFERAEQTLKKLSQKAGKSSDRFNQRCNSLIQAIQREHDIAGYIKSPMDARAVTYLLATDETFATRVEVDEKLLSAIQKARTPLSRLTLLQLIHAFFNFFDRAFPRRVLSLLADFIKAQLARYERPDFDDELGVYAKKTSILFADNGPEQVVSYAKEQEIDLDNALHRLELSAMGSTRFAQICQYHYYLETLRKIPVGEDHSVLAEIVKPDVATARLGGDGGMLGHEVLRIIISRCRNDISDCWQAVVLAIAGDPRVPKTSVNYRKWWAFLDEELIACVRGWLSKLDLSLFLEILEQSGKDMGKADMVEMFRPRRKFMEGLLNQGLVSETRLFLCPWATNYLKKHYKLSELPSYAQAVSTQTSMIYLNIKGKAHMIEGTHSFKLNLFDRLPSDFHLTNYSIQIFTDADIRKKPYSMYMKEFNNEEGARQFVHDSAGNWRRKAIGYIKSVGLDLDATQLMTAQVYRKHRYKFGI